jgi:ferrous iron transport protein A
MNTEIKTLDRMKSGLFCTIKRIHALDIKAQAIRFGLTEGKKVLCSTIIPAGPVVIKINQQEIALGRKLAQQIEVEEVHDAKLP